MNLQNRVMIATKMGVMVDDSLYLHAKFHQSFSVPGSLISLLSISTSIYSKSMFLNLFIIRGYVRYDIYSY